MTDPRKQLNDFTKFPGSIVGNCYEFPVLVSTDSKGKIREWVIKIRLIKEKSRKSKYEIDWNVMAEDEVPILKSYLESADLPAGTIAQIYTETGQKGGKLTRQMPSFPEAKNVGKKNFRNELKTAMIDARSKYNKKVDSGFVEKDKFVEGKKSDNVKYYPMLLHDYRKLSEKIVFPCIAQRKYDGDRAVAFFNSDLKEVVIYSRNLHEYPAMFYIKKEIQKLYVGETPFLTPDIYLDGEFYNHGVKLQEINGAVRLTTDDQAKKLGLEYHIFDAFNIKKPKLNFEERFLVLKEKLGATDHRDFKVGSLVFVESKTIKNEQKLEKYFIKNIEKKYEGIIIRNTDAPYLTSNIKNSASLRSRHVLKYKKKFTDEYPVVGFTSGTNGKEENAVLWIVKLPNGKTLTLQPKNITYEERERLLKECQKSFDSLYNGRMLTVVYDELSSDGTPLRAKAIGFRPTE